MSLEARMLVATIADYATDSVMQSIGKNQPIENRIRDRAKYTYKINSESVFLENTMDNEFENVDYEDMDDLALPDHIEFNHDQPEQFSMDSFNVVCGF